MFDRLSRLVGSLNSNMTRTFSIALHKCTEEITVNKSVIIRACHIPTLIQGYTCMMDYNISHSLRYTPSLHLGICTLKKV